MFTCPICKKDDQIQKASAVYSSGIGTGSFSGPATSVNYYNGKVGVGGGLVSGTSASITEAARKCAPPDKPHPPSTSLTTILGFVGIAFGVLTSICADNYASLWIIGWVIVGFIFIAIGNNQKNAKEIKYKEELVIYNREITEWNELYYCHRDDVLFNPNNGNYWTFTRR